MPTPEPGESYELEQPPLPTHAPHPNTQQGHVLSGARPEGERGAGLGCQVPLQVPRADQEGG